MKKFSPSSVVRIALSKLYSPLSGEPALLTPEELQKLREAQGFLKERFPQKYARLYGGEP